MKQTIIKFGIYSAVTAAVLFFLALTLGSELSYTTQEIIGYSNILISLSFVFFAIKHYRDNVNNGIISFKKAFIIGILITLIASTMVGIIDRFYVAFINPDFMQEYLNYHIEAIESSGLSAAEISTQKQQMIDQMELFKNPIIAFSIMFFTVFFIGIIISSLSSLILQRKQ